MPGGRLRAAPDPRRGAQPDEPAARARAALRAARRGRRGRARMLRRAAPGRRAGRRRLRRRAGRRWPRVAAADPARADRGRQPPRDHQPAARAVARAASAWRSRSPGRDGAALPSSPAGRCRRRCDRPRRGAGALRHRPTARRACSSSAARSARARSTRPRSRRFAGAPFRVLHAAGDARLRRARARGSTAPAYDLRPYIDDVRRTRWPRATSSSRAPAARSSRSPRTASRRSSCPIRTPAPTTRPPTRAGWPTRARRSSCRTRELTPARLAREVARAARRPGAAGGDGGAPRRRWPGRTRPQAVADEVLAAAAPAGCDVGGAAGGA